VPGTNERILLVQAAPILIKVDGAARGETLRHVWSWYGYDECNYTTSPGGKQLLVDLASINPAAVYIRAHHFLTSGDGKPSLKWSSTNVYTEDAAGNPVYDWRLLDEIMDTIVAAGCVPYVEIAFMPQALSSKPDPYIADTPAKIGGGASYPPKDYQKWYDLIHAWAARSKDRYPDCEKKWIWELWNEPDIVYWRGSIEEYCKLYDYTEAAIHDAMPAAIVGGPDAAGGGSELFIQFMDHCVRGTNAVTGKKGARVDLLSFHAKGRTAFIDGHVQMDLSVNLQRIQTGFSNIAKVTELRDKPVVIGECDPEGWAARSSKLFPANGYRNGSAYAAYEVAVIKHTLDLARKAGIDLQGILTWAFMFDDKEYFEGFRTLATNGIHKPVLSAFKMLSKLRGGRVPATSGGAVGLDGILSRGIRHKPDIDVLATATPDSVQALIWNYHDNMVEAAPARVRLSAKVQASMGGQVTVRHWRIDESHSNAYSKWLALGSPQNPSAAQLDDLKQAMGLELLGPDRVLAVSAGVVETEFDLPRHAVSLIEIEKLASLSATQ
jgi:xylan 1,4-beta-xylosidase